ncbi:MAG: VOC family protein [Chloroflexota bacterium]
MTLRINPYLMFDGNAREAVAFYERALDARSMGIMTFGEAHGDQHAPVPEAARGRIMHAQLRVGETDLMFSDTLPGTPHRVGNNINIAIVTDDADQTKRIFDALADGGQVVVPLQATFWSPAYGQLTDRYGATWQITTEKPADRP